jgi:putative salt-induced outer membrane protein
MTRRLRRTLLLTVLLLHAASIRALAQPPAPAPGQPPPPPPPQEGTAEASFIGTSGNTSTQAIGLGGELTVRRAPWVYNTKAVYVRNEDEDNLKAESFAALFRASRTLTERVSAYGRYDFLRNAFAGIDSRNTISGGLEYLLIKPEPHNLKINAGVGYTNEQRAVGEDLSTAEFLTGALYKWTISPTADFTDDFQFNVSFSDAGDWRNANIASVTAKLTTLLSLKASNTVRYVHQPVIGFETTDTITALALVLKF